MHIFILLALLLSNAFAVEVLTLTFPGPSATEFMLVMTDSNFQSNMEKHFVAKNCKMRITNNGSVHVRENYFAKVCRAEVIKFILNNDYKPDPLYQVFIK